TVRRYLLEGLAQSIDTVLPRVMQYRRFKPFVEDTLPGLLQNSSALVAHPGATTPCPRQIPAPAGLVVGPEGGFTDYELDKLTAQGCTAVHLGPRILRVENAVSRLLGKLI
ncbi:MAG: RNA methyltransferase, partial [Halioglobus sp.]|nr:RNA methyltransferase [Halioglobus sp.]